MKISCANWGVPDDSDNEIEDIKESINQIASLTGIDGRVILSIIMQESTGCVRVSKYGAIRSSSSSLIDVILTNGFHSSYNVLFPRQSRFDAILGRHGEL